ncbi:MAG: ZIP family metal transporter [Candidatus Paceibacterota bacterium]
MTIAYINSLGMSTIYFYSFISVLVVSLVSFIGVFTLSLRAEVLKKYLTLFISLAIGALLGDVFIHIIPHAFEDGHNELAGMLFILGIFGFFILEKFFHWHHHENDSAENHIHPVGKLVLVSDGMHNFLDGIIIGASFLVSVPVGIATTIAVILHEIPQEIGDFAVLLHSGYSKIKALWLNFASALLSFLGLAFVFILGGSSEHLIEYIVPIAGGGFIYIALADLVPELQKSKRTKDFIAQIIFLMIGVGIMLLLTMFESH